MTTNTQMAEPVEAAVLDSTYIGSVRGAFGTIPRAKSRRRNTHLRCKRAIKLGACYYRLHQNSVPC